MSQLHPSRVLAAMSVLGIAMAWGALANPVGGKVVAGTATVVQTSPHRLDIVQKTDRAIVNWQSFSIGAGEHVNFNQPSVQASTLNRVTGADPSSILGRLTANGRVFLVNPNGIVFDRQARIDVAGIVASTANISDANFMAGRYRFDEPGNRAATIVNRGHITVAEGGLAALIAPGVANTGLIHARLGRVVLASGDTFTIDLYGDRLINLAVDARTLEGLRDASGVPLPALVDQAGEVRADGGSVLITAAAARDIVDNVISASGIVRAQSVERRNGEIVLLGPERGNVAVSGVLDASGPGPGQTGGTVNVLGDRVALQGTARIDVSGHAGGGTARIGGDYQGRAPLRAASETRVEQGAVIAADALSNGDGGNVIVWADGSNAYSGSISANGGFQGGDGGFIEVSGKESLIFRGAASAHSPNGQPGTLLLDPRNLEVGTSGKTDLAGATGNDGQAAVFAAGEDAGSDATVQASTVANLLNTGTSVSLQASEDLTVSARIDGRGGPSGAGLVLGAGRNVLIANDILTADGNVTVEAANGTLAMAAGPADSITAGQGTVISAGRGSIALRAGGDVSVQHLLSSTAVEVTSTTGSVDLARGFGGSGANRFEQGALTVTAANAVNVNGTIVAGGPVRLSGSDVVLRHSIFTNNQRIELGRAGGTVTLDPAGDEQSSSVIRDARTGEDVREPPVTNGTDGTYTVVAQSDGTFSVDGATEILSGTTNGSRSTPAVTIEAETRRVTIDAGTTGADISFLGEIVGPPGVDQRTRGLFDRTQASQDPTAPGRREPNQRLSGNYVTLDLAAGSGTVRFDSGIGTEARGTPAIANDPDSNFQDTAGHTTLDLTIRSAATLIYDAANVFVNSFQRPASTVLIGGPIQPIFRAPINVEAFSVDPDGGNLQSEGFPPIFPEPNLAQPFNVSSSTLSFSLPGAPGVPLSVATTSIIGQAVSQAVRESEFLQDTTTTETADAGQSPSRLADMGRSAPADGAAADVFGGSSPLVRVRGRADESTQDVPYVEPDVFGRPTREDEESR
jgi:filamentous hemagglutinin family protein